VAAVDTPFKGKEEHVVKDYEKHVIKGDGCNCTAWCGAETLPMDWVFRGVGHAIASIEQGTTTVPCPACLKAVIRVLSKEE
jgi:hypothetical protein